MQRDTLRTAALRLLALAMLLVSIMCCAGPTETVEEASEATISIPPLDPSPRVTVAPRPTGIATKPPMVVPCVLFKTFTWFFVGGVAGIGFLDRCEKWCQSSKMPPEGTKPQTPSEGKGNK